VSAFNLKAITFQRFKNFQNVFFLGGGRFIGIILAIAEALYA
jgi:hypothetical protein